MHLTVRPLTESDLPEARRVFGLAFGTFLGLPDPARFGADRDYPGTRFRSDPTSAFGAESNGRLIGSNFAAWWGSVAFFGPLTVHPKHWDSGVGKHLMEPVMGCFERWRVRLAGLYTFAQSAKHIGLYRKRLLCEGQTRKKCRVCEAVARGFGQTRPSTRG